MKEYLLVRGRGQLMPYADLVGKARARQRVEVEGELDCKALVGAVDLRPKAATATIGKTHGPRLVPPEVFKAAPSDMIRLLDPISVEATITADVPLGFQGGDSCVLLENPLKSHQSQENQRSIYVGGS